MNGDSLVRRQYLAAFPVVTVLAGCAGTFGGGDSSQPTPALLGLSVQNSSIESYTIAVTVERDGTVAHSESYTLRGIDIGNTTDDGSGTLGPGSFGSATVEGPWLGDEVPYTVRADVTDGETGTYTTDQYVSGRDDIDCPGFDVAVIVSGGAVEFQVTPAPPGCQATPWP